MKISADFGALFNFQAQTRIRLGVNFNCTKTQAVPVWFVESNTFIELNSVIFENSSHFLQNSQIEEIEFPKFRIFEIRFLTREPNTSYVWCRNNTGLHQCLHKQNA